MQIARIKIQKHDAKKSKEKFISNPEKFIEEILYTFTPMIEAKELNVFVLRKNDFSNLKVAFDWSTYQLILFNII